jgi:hypothetical protein
MEKAHKNDTSNISRSVPNSYPEAPHFESLRRHRTFSGFRGLPQYLIVRDVASNWLTNDAFPSPLNSLTVFK